MFQRHMLLATTPMPAFIGAAGNSVTSNTTIAVTPPANAKVGDLLIALLDGGSANAWNTASGWTEVADQAAVPGIGVQWRIHDGSSSYSFTRAGSSGPLVAQIIAIRDAVFDAVGTFGTRATGNSALFDAPSINVGGIGGMLGIWLCTDGTSSSGGDYETPSGFTDVLYSGAGFGGQISGKSFLRYIGPGATGAISTRIAVATGNKASVQFSVRAP